jgi:hypothetical protein
MSGRWVELREAAELLGTSTEAVRKRAARGSLRSDRQDGRVLVWVDEGRTEGGREAQVDREALLEAKDETIRLLREQLEQASERDRENRRIIAALTSRIPELEAPSQEPRESPSEGTAPEQELQVPGPEEPQRGFWARLFGG